MRSIKRSVPYFLLFTCLISMIFIFAFTVKNETHQEDSGKIDRVEAEISKTGFPYQIGESQTFKNLQVFFLSTDNNIIRKEYVTLAEAMAGNYVTVFETENVNQLAVENTSNHFVFICSGDIVKGGKQDRTIAKDIILPPKSGQVPIGSFCVESGRWSQRNQEQESEFSESLYLLSSRDLKVAAKKSKSQSEVWSNVSRQQDKVNESMKANYNYEADFDVKNEVSESSLQLMLENEELQKIKAEYKSFFSSLKIDTSTTVGFVYAINGEIYGIDAFHNYKLFTDLWPKLLDAIIVEAISDDNQKKSGTVEAKDILALPETFTGENLVVDKEEINSETTYIVTSLDNLVKTETIDKREQGRLLHLNYIVSSEKSQIEIKTNGSPENSDIELQQNLRSR